MVERVREFGLSLDCSSGESTNHLLETREYTVKYIVYKQLRYVYDDDRAKYILLR